MQIFKQTNYYVAVLLAAAVFAGCNKDAHAPKPTAAASATAATSNSSNNNMVITPAGMMAKENVHFVEPGNELRVFNGHIQKIESASGKMLQDFGAVTTTLDTHSSNKQMDGLTPTAVNGWAAYTYWANNIVMIDPISYFTTSWTVPAVPRLQGSQTVFLFNGMQDGETASSYIIQPVLQWGASAAGGGKYWAVTNWYVSSKQAFFGTLQTVTAGTKLQGVMTETGTTGSNYNYTSAFVGLPAAVNITVSNVPQAYWAAETLEVYGVSVAGQYPNQTSMDFSGIQILKRSSNAVIKWTPVAATGGALPSATVTSSKSPNGDVTINF
jgi:hypothetical protein